MSDLSRVEQLLRNALGEDIYEVTPQSRIEVLLQQLNELIEDIGEGSIDPEVITAWLAENIHDGAVVDFDVVTIDYVNSTVKCVRIGRGQDRTFSFD